MSACISLTTIPDRIAHIEPILAALCGQGLPVYLWPVERIKRSATQLVLPGFLSDYPVTVRVVKDRGPLTKLLPALRLDYDYVLTADDDVLYGEGWAAGLLAWAEKLPGAALAYRGRVLTGQGYTKSKLVQYYRVKKAVPVDILTGVFGALYPRAAFARSIFTEWHAWTTNDDLVIAAHLKARNVPRYVVPGKCKIHVTGVQKVTALCAVNRRKGDQRNDAGLKKLGLE